MLNTDFNFEQAKSILSRQLGGVKLGLPDGLPISQVNVGGTIENGWQGKRGTTSFFRINVSGYGQFDVAPSGVTQNQALPPASQDVRIYRNRG